MTTTRFYFACAECDAGRGVPCHPSCPSRLAHDRDLIEADEDGYEPPLSPFEVLPGGGRAL